MDDRELLEAAARAAGVDVRWHEPWQCHVHVGAWHAGRPLMHRGQMAWSPLADDGDAFRLAVALRMEVDVYYGEVASGEEGDRQQTLIGEGDDRCAEVRRAIVRAAAEIGKALAGAEAGR